MTLSEWSELHGVPVNANPSFHVLVDTVTVTDDAMHSLYRLSDYAVSTRSGPIVWVKKREVPSPSARDMINAVGAILSHKQ